MTQEGLRPLLYIVANATKQMKLNNAFLTFLQKGKLSKENWIKFGIQRYLAAIPFTYLLRSTIKKAKKANDHTLARAIQDNLNDELGIDQNGLKSKDASHETWRKNFYSAIGIDSTMLKKKKARKGTTTYNRTLRSIIKDGTLLESAGALLALEATFPIEFQKIKSGRDKTFPEKFIERVSDSKIEKERKKKARKYIDDHIMHDAKKHYPDILHALVDYASDPRSLSEIERGALKIAEARAIFYADLKTH